MKINPAEISRVLEGSIAQDVGIEPGDILLSVNGRPVEDVFGYRFLCADEEIVIEVKKKTSEIWEIEIEKDPDEDIGIEFVNPLMSEEKHCRNNCIFCFIDQLPDGMRESLYFKDDDARLSFLTGNYVTLTNMDDDEMDRIISYRLSPINVSVHTTNPLLRSKMLNNRHGGNVLDKIRKMIQKGLKVNAQIVVCRGWNDRAELDRSLLELTGLYPGVASICVVPVGITKFRAGLEKLEPFDTCSAQGVIGQIDGVQSRMLDNYGSRVVYAADEFYLTAELAMPGVNEYEDFPQLENGVGMMALMEDQVKRRLKEIRDIYGGKPGLAEPVTVSVATGISAGKFISGLAEQIMQSIDGVNIQVFPVENTFFGKTVTVAGLLTGGDLTGQLKQHDLGDMLLIPSSMLRAGEQVFLDDCTVADVERELNIKIVVSDSSGADFIRAVTKL